MTAVLGLVGVVSGRLNLAIANGGPGTGNGVVGGAGALVLGPIAMALSALGLAGFTPQRLSWVARDGVRRSISCGESDRVVRACTAIRCR
jgi:Family of unknown function (DUF6223)